MIFAQWVFFFYNCELHNLFFFYAHRTTMRVMHFAGCFFHNCALHDVFFFIYFPCAHYTTCFFFVYVLCCPCTVKLIEILNITGFNLDFFIIIWPIHEQFLILTLTTLSIHLRPPGILGCIFDTICVLSDPQNLRVTVFGCFL